LPARYVALCPNNPYWWPVFTDVRRAFEDDAAGAQSPLRHGPYTFHSWDDTRAAHFAEYKRGFAAIAHGLQKRGYSPVLVAMERLDREACQEIAALLPCGVPIVARGDQTLDAVAATLEGAACVVTTRYHASLLAIANATPVIGVSMDSRINNLFRENALADWIVSCDMPAFEHAVLERIDAGTSTDLDRLREKYTSISQRERRTLATMGTRLVARIHAASP
jgi:polysaccharide pyruvyl transferase WcaK-like protein